MKRLIGGFIVLGWMGAGVGAELRFAVEWSPAQLIHHRLDEYDLVGLEGCGFTHEIGAPLVPVRSVQVSVPAGAVVTGVEVVASEYQVLPGFYNPYPAQPPRPISGAEPGFVHPDPEIYTRAEPYPGELVRFVHQGSLGGYELAGFLVYPVQYLPSEGRLWLYTRIEVRVSYELKGQKGPTPRFRSHEIEGLYEGWVEGVVENPWDVARNRPGIYRSELAPDGYEYVIITAEEYREKFKPLSDWLTKKGVPDTIVSLEDIYGRYPGKDNQERIRNFIRDAYENWSTVWVLLGGDTDLLPHRKTWILSSGYTNGDYWLDTIPCDLYYSDLDRDWDGDGDGVYGEPEDGVDMYPDVFVGRAPVNDISEVETFVDKVLRYEREPELGYQPKLLLPAEILFYSPFYPGDIVNDSIASLAPGDYQKSKLYQTQEDLTSQAVLDSIEAGHHFIHFAAHGNIDVISTGLDAIYTWDADNLTNGGLLPISVGICCLIGAMDFDCIVERFMNNPNGGTVAWVANSRFGWGTPPWLGPSERLNISFFDRIFNWEMTRVGKTLGAAKSEHIPEAAYDPFMRWCVYALNLFGEPQLQMYTTVPIEMVVSHPDSIPLGEQCFTVAVSDGAGPIPGALVCLLKTDDVYEYGLTGDDGKITFYINPRSPGGMWVTATAQDRLVYEGSCKVGGVLGIAVSPDTLYPQYSLSITSPNPGVGRTGLQFGIPISSRVELKVYDSSGKLVRTLVARETLAPGRYSLVWDLRDEAGRRVPEGVYFIRMDSAEYQATRKLILLR